MWYSLLCLVLLSHGFSFTYAAIRVPNGKKPMFAHQKEGINSRETTAEYWNGIAQDILRKAKLKKPITNVAKNVILFLGDGMSVATVTAARIHVGGESNLLSFEKFPYTAVSKTYCLNRMVSESTSTATAYLGGVKANWYTSGVTGAVKLGDCEGSLLPENQVPSIAAWSQKEGKWTGFVTTTRITHASPADIVMLQEVAINDFSFIGGYNSIVNINENRRGTAVLIRDGLNYEDVRALVSSRGISFKICST
ncbi:hypothetical protein HHI36_022418 [Cryptolaemus montrouzieri]|uniref:alkaline phosphatase n=1 Tax=Cryptolaemus montrouzieri TaxID=559131 RepID=A0ABD2MZR2_9CUCU